MALSPHVVIVGAGPAGASAAIFLAQQGARVTVLERAYFPRDKVCGDGCSPRCVMLLQQLGLTGLLAAESQPITHYTLISPGETVLHESLATHAFGGRGLVIPRQVFDATLICRAVAVGAELRQGQQARAIRRHATRVEVEVDRGAPLSADVVLGCDGSPSLVRRALGGRPFPKPHLGIAIRVYYENVRLSAPHAFLVSFQRPLLPGYGWIFPLPGGRANVGVSMRADYLARSSAKLRALLERFCNAPRIAKELAGGRRIGPALGHQLPLGSFNHQVVFDRALLLGDAAGFINPFSGEGIEFALESGMYAAQAIAQAEQRGNFSAAGLHTYADLCALHFRHSFHFAHVMQRCFAWPRLVDFLLERARRSDAVRALLDNAFNGQKTRCSWTLLKGLTRGSP